MQPKVMRSWNLVFAVRRDRMQVSLVPVPQSSADVPVLPVFSPAKCSMYRFSGTHAHSWIMSFPDEYTAFKTYAKLYPNACTLLVDTYDVLKSGVPNAIRVFEEMREEGIPLTKYGIRIDSGDLAYLSKEAYKMLAAAGFDDAIISGIQRSG